jgi:magnesium transporter
MNSDTVSEFTRAMLTTYPSATAQALMSQDPKDVGAFLELVPSGELTTVIGELPASYAASYLSCVNTEKLLELANLMSLGQLAGVLRCLEQPLRDQIVKQLSSRKSLLLGSVNFPEGTVGAWIYPDPVIVPPGSSVRDAMRRSRRLVGPENSLIAVVRHNGQYLGVADPAKLIRTPTNTPIEDVLESDLQPLQANMNLVDAVSHDAWLHRRAMPVIDGRRQFVGILYYSYASRTWRVAGSNCQ